MAKTIKSYGSASGSARLLTDLYGSSNSQSQMIIKLYGSTSVQTVTGVTGTIRAGSTNVTAFDGEIFWSAAGGSVDTSKTMSYLRIYITGKSRMNGGLYLYYTDGTFQYIVFSPVSVPDFSPYGVTISSSSVETNDYIDLTPTYETSTQAELIHQGFGHYDYGN